MKHLIDSHAHLTCDPQYFSKVDEILARASDAGIKKVINICTDIPSMQRGLALKKKYPWIFNSAAITPHDVEEIGEASFNEIEAEAKRGNLIAIGETGLDYYYAHSEVSIQKKFLKKYLHLALSCKLPVIIHCRDAFSDFFEILDKEYLMSNKEAKGVLHCFTGTLQEAEEVIKRGFYLSLSGIVTFKKSIELQEVAKMVPLHKLLIETDAPFLAPQSKRGKTNEPAFLRETAAFIASIKNISVDELIYETTNNVESLFSLHNL